MAETVACHCRHIDEKDSESLLPQNNACFPPSPPFATSARVDKSCRISHICGIQSHGCSGLSVARRGSEMNVNSIKEAIESLPKEDYGRLRRWFSDRDWERWDAEIEEDSDSGKLDFLVKEALEEKQAGDLKDL